MKYFYIIERNGTITEIPYTDDNYKKAFEEWVNGGRLIVRPQGHTIPVGINAVDITKICDPEAYLGYIESARIQTYILDGVWYDRKERREVRLEAWKQRERNETKKLPSKATQREISPEEQASIARRKEAIREGLRTGFKKAEA